MADKLFPRIFVLSNVFKLTHHLAKVLPQLEFVDIKSSDASKDLKEAEIIIADLDLITPHLNDLNKTKWIQATWAGADYLTKNLTTQKNGDFFGQAMTEYCIAQIVSYERGFNNIFTNQNVSKWNRDGKIYHHRLISDLTIGILGAGTIGNQIAKSLNSLNAKILAFKRSNPSSMPNFISKIYNFSHLNEMLSECDYLINVLPSTEETRNLLGNDILKSCSKRETIFINIGRGDIIKEESLIRALDNKWIGGAILDVFPIEPLPESSPLWKYPGVVITPHVSGVSRADHIAELFKENYSLFTKGSPLKNILQLDRGY